MPEEPPESPSSDDDPGPGSRGAPVRPDARRLGLLVEAEARRMLSEAQLEADPDRSAAGWVRRFIADRVRAEEAMELYSRLGYEVCADPVVPEELADDCEDCQLVARMRFVTIYTRRPAEGSD